VHAVLEARRAAPAILHLPHLQLWWDTAPPSLRATLWMLLADLPGDRPLLLMASADVPFDQLDEVFILTLMLRSAKWDALLMHVESLHAIFPCGCCWQTPREPSPAPPGRC